MAIRWATKSGNWSDSTVWNGGTLPTSADDVYANTFTVAVDQNVTVLSIRNSVQSANGVVAGGGFTLAAALTIDCSGGSGFLSSAATLLTISTTTGTVTLRGAITGGSTTAVSVVAITGTCTVNVTGNVTGGSTNTSVGISVSNACILNVTGSVSAGSGSNTSGISISSAATVTVVGAITGSASNTSIGIASTNSSAIITITGALTGGAGGTAAAAVSSAGGITVTGSLTGGAANALVVTTSGVTSTVTGPFIASSAGIMPMSVGTSFVRVSPISNNEYRFKHVTSGTTSLWSSDVNGNQPIPANVRSGTVYGTAGAYTGTLIVPPTNAVSAGVPVDNTVGTAALTPADVAALVGAQVTAALDSLP